MKYFFYYVKKLIRFLGVQPVIGGLEISDLALRFARFNGREWQMVSLKVPPGVMKAGQVMNYAELVQILKKLRDQIPGLNRRREKVSVILSSGSLSIYSQVLSLPELEESKLDESVRLNIQMISPVDLASVYSDWQVVGKDETSHKLEVLSAFVKKTDADEVNKALGEAGFLAVALESKALALARVIRKQALGIEPSKSYIVLSLDNEVLDFLIIRHGQLYFEYLNYWKDIRGEAKVISLLDFRNAIASNLKQVFNFYSQHWSESLGGVILVTPGLEEEIKKITADTFSLPVLSLKLRMDRPVDPEWFGAIGSGVRGVMPREEDRDVSLLGVTARAEFRAQQVIGFFKFWRILVPVALSFLLAAFFIGKLLLDEKRQDLVAIAPSFDTEEVREIESLQNEAKHFNSLVEVVGGFKQKDQFKTPSLRRVYDLVAANNIVLERFGFGDFGSPVTLSGVAKSKNDISGFEKALQEDGHFSQVRLPLTEIRESPQGFTFSISFVVAVVIAN